VRRSGGFFLRWCCRRSQSSWFCPSVVLGWSQFHPSGPRHFGRSQLGSVWVGDCNFRLGHPTSCCWRPSQRRSRRHEFGSCSCLLASTTAAGTRLERIWTELQPMIIADMRQAFPITAALLLEERHSTMATESTVGMFVCFASKKCETALLTKISCAKDLCRQSTTNVSDLLAF